MLERDREALAVIRKQSNRERSMTTTPAEPRFYIAAQKGRGKRLEAEVSEMSSDVLISFVAYFFRLAVEKSHQEAR